MINSSISAWTGRCILGSVLGLYIAYAYYMASYLPVFPTELAYANGQGGWLFSTIRRFWELAFGDNIMVIRGLSILFALGAILLAYLVGRILSGDQTVGAFLALGFVLFPPMVGIFSLATPHALATFLSLGAVILSVKPRRHTVRCWRSIVAFVLMAMAVIISLNGLPANKLAGTNQDTIISAVLVPYSMLWIGALTGLVASLSPEVSERMGLAGIWIARGASALVVGLLLVLFFFRDMPMGQYMVMVGYVFGICLMGVLPLIVWVRVVMPNVRSILAWLIFPVIMYSGFWVVFGSIDQGFFPYNRLGLGTNE